jgi:hypothetical protein
MSRKKPAPDLIRGGNRFSEKDVRLTEKDMRLTNESGAWTHIEEPFDLVESAIKVRAEADRIAAISFTG